MRRIAQIFLLITMWWNTSVSARDLDPIRDLWRAEDYAQVITQLLAIRDLEFGRNGEVDYMLATSLCRTSGEESFGRTLLTHILRVYELSAENRAAIRAERDGCSQRTEPVTVAFLTTRATGGGDSGVRGKLFYFLGGENRAIGGDPLEATQEIPSEELRARLFKRGDSAAATAMARRLGTRASVYVSQHFVIGSISDHSQDDLKEIARLLEKALDFFVKSYDIKMPDSYISVYLVPDGNLMRQMGEKLHGLRVARGTIGYSFRNDLSVSAVVRGPYTGTLKHELTHLLVRTNFGDIPPWLDEGLAALYEVSRQEGDFLRGLPNWRGGILKRFWRGEPDIEDLIGQSWAEFDEHGGSMQRQAVHHALARYWVLYLQETERLPAVYAAVRDQDIRLLTTDPAADARRVVESATDQDLDALEREFQRWYAELNRTLTAEDVIEIQRRLIELGYSPGVIDGIVGRDTRAAVRAFKRDYEYSTVDGQVDTLLLGDLRAKTGK